MKKKLRIGLSVAAAMVALASCAPIYIPNAANVPMFTEKQELKVAVPVGTNGYDVQIAYSVLDHLAVMANGSYNSKTNDSDSKDFHKHLWGELGAGYYTMIGDQGRFECFGGYGMGYSETGTANDFVDAGFCLRGSYVNFYKFKTDFETYDEHYDNFFIEPIGFVRAGWKYAKFQFQVGWSFYAQEELNIENQPFIMNFGLVFYIPLMKGGFKPGK